MKIENGDARRLSYLPNSFDIVVSSLAIHNIPDASERAKALDGFYVWPSPAAISPSSISSARRLHAPPGSGRPQIVQRSGTSFLWCIPSPLVYCAQELEDDPA